jgi:alpha-D-ribose 1-methylphosphonate 5-phosphate C-P lyase
MVVQWLEGSNFIPGKCFLLFQDHGLAHVQPQTQCTITGAAREERSEVKKERGKQAFGIQDTNHSEHYRSRHKKKTRKKLLDG